MSQLAIDFRVDSDVVHVLMPCMGYACGATIIDVAGRFQVGINDWTNITCPGCLEVGEAGIREEMARQQGVQAAIS